MRKTLIAVALAGAATMVPAASASAKDVNHDRIPDRWERAYHLSLKVDQSKRDQDHDGLKNRAEWVDHTSPRSADTDRDGVTDGHEDANHDGVSNGDEQRPPEPHVDTPPAEPGPGDGARHEEGPGDGAVTPGDGAVTPPPPSSDDHHAAGAAIVSYEQSPGFGGYLTIARSNGEHVRSYLGEKTDLECSSTPDGPFTACSKEHLVDGTAVAQAEHGVNDFGHDVWTRVYLVVPESAG